MNTVPDRQLALLPPGVRVLLPRDSRNKRRFVNQLCERAQSWGFSELDLPTLDYYESMTAGVSEDLARRTYQFHDDEGERLALRPDATAQLAKILSGRFDREELPGRYCYVTRNFRAFELRRGELREFEQFGAEILREDRFSADLELLLLMFELMSLLGRDNLVIDLGHVQVYQGLVDDLGLSKRQRQELWKTIHRKNVPGLRKVLDELPVAEARREFLLELPDLYGEAVEFERWLSDDRLPDRTREGLEYLRTLERALERAGYGDSITLDLGVVRDLDYYTGIVFEGLLPGVGQPVVGGGRYDRLYPNYGVELPATGFAIEIHRLIPLLKQARENGELVEVYCPESTDAALECLRELRREDRVAVNFREPPDRTDDSWIDPEGVLHVST